MHKPRNNIAKLPIEARTCICAMLLDGATYDDIRADQTVAQACTSRKVTIHNATFGIYRESEEYQEYCRSVRKWGDDIERRRIAAQVVNGSGSTSDMARIATYELMRQTLDLLENGGEIDAATLRSVSGALAAYERNRIRADSQTASHAAERREARLLDKISKLEEKIAALSEELAKKNAEPAAAREITPEQIDEIRARLGL